MSPFKFSAHQQHRSDAETETGSASEVSFVAIMIILGIAAIIGHAMASGI